MTDNQRPLVGSVTEVIEAAARLESRRVLDVGCGSGGLVRWLAGRGARVTGLETQARLVDLARSRQPVAGEAYVEGRGEALPFADGEFDLVIFSYSLHHIPAPVMVDALREAGRVLAAEGRVLVIEPVADGDYFEVMRLIDDETEVRRLALEALRTGAHELSPGAERIYRIQRFFENSDAFVANALEVDPARNRLIEAKRREIDERFRRHGRPTDRGYCFEMEIRSNLLLKSSSAPA